MCNVKTNFGLLVTSFPGDLGRSLGRTSLNPLLLLLILIFRYSDHIVKAYSTYRHFNVTVILLTQYNTSVATAVRQNSDFVLIMNNCGDTQKEGIAKDHLDFIPNLKVAKRIISTVAFDHNVLVVEKLDPNQKPMEKLSITRGEVIDPNVPLGNLDWWRIINREDKREVTSGDVGARKRVARERLAINMARSNVFQNLYIIQGGNPNSFGV
jgi:hypothetical protein